MPGIGPHDPGLNDHIMYAKCVKGHILRDASDWLQCENLPEPGARCWQEGGETLLTVGVRKRDEANAEQSKPQAARS